MGSGALIVGDLLFFVVGLAFFVLGIIINWKIWSKAGFNGALSLLMFVPLLNFIMICVLAFSEWPVRRELEQLRAQLMMRGPQYPPQYPQQYPPQQYPPQYPQQYPPQYPR